MAVFAPALAIALPGNRSVSAALPAKATGRQDQVDEGEHVIDALGVLLDAARVQEEARLRHAPHARCGTDLLGRHPGNCSSPLRSTARHRCSKLVPARAALAHERLVDPAMLDELMEQRLVECAVGARPDGKVQVSGSPDGGDARIDDDDSRASIARLPDVVRKRRKAFADVRAGDQDELGLGQVGP